MNVNVRADSVEIEGYVNAIERASKPLMSRIGKFIERICKGAFSKALQRNDYVHILLNHDWNRDLGSTKQGNLELEEDNIGLHARAVITDSDVVEKAKNGDLVGWSFGFQDRDVEQTVEKGYPCREVKDLDLFEVSILDRTKTPAYDGTLLMARSEDDVEYRSEPFLDGINITVDVSFTQKEVVEVPDEQETVEEVKEEITDEPEIKEVDYSPWEAIIKDMKGE